MSWRRGEGAVVTTLPEREPTPFEGAVDPPNPPSPITRWRKIAASAVAIVLATALGWQLTRNGPSDGSTRPTSPTTVGSVVPSTAAAGSSMPPELRNTGDDFDTIVRSVDDFENWVYQFDPDPKWADSTIHPENTDEYGYERERTNLAAFKAAGHHYDAPPTRIRNVIVRRQVTDDQVAVYVVREALPANVVDRDGNVVVKQPVLPPTGYLEDWVRDDGRWRLFHTEVLGPPAPELVK